MKEYNVNYTITFQNYDYVEEGQYTVYQRDTIDLGDGWSRNVMCSDDAERYLENKYQMEGEESLVAVPVDIMEDGIGVTQLDITSVDVKMEDDDLTFKGNGVTALDVGMHDYLFNKMDDEK